MKKKLVAGAVTLLSVVTLAACANGTKRYRDHERGHDYSF